MPKLWSSNAQLTSQPGAALGLSSGRICPVVLVQYGCCAVQPSAGPGLPEPSELGSAPSPL